MFHLQPSPSSFTAFMTNSKSKDGILTTDLQVIQMLTSFNLKGGSTCTGSSSLEKKSEYLGRQNKVENFNRNTRIWTRGQ